MCAVLFFPLGFNEAAHRDKGGYLQKSQEEIPFKDRTLDFTKEKSDNHKLDNRRYKAVMSI